MFRDKNWTLCFSGATLQDFLIWKKNKIGELTSVNYDYKNQGPRQRESQIMLKMVQYICLDQKL